MPEMTNKEIWEMLKPKFEKNNLFNHPIYVTHIGTLPNECSIDTTYYKQDVIDAVALAYHCGYERAMKGRPFKIDEKKNEEKKGGHWEPVDPNNLPKEGTRVRYSRECKDYKNCESEIVIGDMSIVRFEGPEHDWFGIKPDNPRKLYYNWLSFDDDSAGCFDMWVEDEV